MGTVPREGGADAFLTEKSACPRQKSIRKKVPVPGKKV